MVRVWSAVISEFVCGLVNAIVLSVFLWWASCGRYRVCWLVLLLVMIALVQRFALSSEVFRLVQFYVSFFAMIVAEIVLSLLLLCSVGIAIVV